MDRRAYLATIGASVFATALTGCSEEGSGGSGGGGDPADVEWSAIVGGAGFLTVTHESGPVIEDPLEINYTGAGMINHAGEWDESDGVGPGDTWTSKQQADPGGWVDIYVYVDGDPTDAELIADIELNG